MTGLYLYQKESQELKVLKEMLQLVRTTHKGSAHSFSYVEAETSLHPQLSLWENLRIETGLSTWADFERSLNSDCLALVNLLNDTDKVASQSEGWEKFLVSFVKAITNPSQNLLIDMNEDCLNPFLIRKMKEHLVRATDSKNIFLASAHTSLWLDCSHTIVRKNEFKFEMNVLGPDQIKKHWAA